jgi:sterol 14-demethylase
VARAIPELSGGGRRFGQLQALRHDPLRLFRRLRDECGEIGRFRLLDRDVAFVCGPEAQEAFFRQADEVLDPQPTSNELMRPIFGEGVVYDAPPEKRREMIRSPALRDSNLRQSAQIIAEETERMVAPLAAEGEMDLLDFTAELTIYTSSATLIGRPFRESLTPEFSRKYFELEVGTDAIGYINSHVDIEAFRVRDRARERLVELVGGVIEARRHMAEPPRDLLGILLSLKDGDQPRYSTSVITGILVSTMFAGHHTSAGTAAWTLVELLRGPGQMKRVVEELDQIYADGRDVSYQALREIPQLENAVKEALRLHPPLIILMRKVQRDFHYKRWTVRAGDTVAVSPAVSNRMPECFPEPDRFDPSRYAPPREEDKQGFAWIPFGGGRHRCVGAAFAMMQLKAIFSVVLRRYEFEMAQPSASYRNDHSKMVVQLEQPCRVRYRLREASEPAGAAAAREHAPLAAGRLRVDWDLCQGHGVCAGEAPEVFRVDPGSGKVELLLERPPEALRARVEKAVRYCPTRALSLDED